GGRMPHVEIVVVGVPPQAFAGRRARVKVTDRFVVRKKVNARADPEWSREIPFQLDEPPEVDGTRRIDPQIARRTAAITFPPCRVERVPADKATAVRRERNVDRRAERQAFWGATVARNAPELRRPERLLR